jgi:hypothetical protein
MSARIVPSAPVSNITYIEDMMAINARSLPRVLAMVTLGASLATVHVSTLQAQPPRQLPQTLSRARQECDAVAQRNGYRVLRRDRETTDGSSYQLPLHVSHAGTQADVTCRYDTQRGVAELPRWEDRQQNVPSRVQPGLGGADQTAQQACQNFLNTKRGYQVSQMGTPTRQGQRLWDIPVTVRRNGRRETTVTCRYNSASTKVSLR